MNTPVPEKIKRFWRDYYRVYGNVDNYKVNAEMLDDLADKINEILDYLATQERKAEEV